MKPSICICCGEKIFNAETDPGKNPNVCRPCEHLVEAGAYQAFQNLVQALTNILMRNPQGSSPAGPVDLPQPKQSPQIVQIPEDDLCFADIQRN